MSRITPTLIGALVVLAAAQAPAGVVTSLVGDKDGFGLAGAPAVPADGTLWRDTLGGVFFTDYRDAGDLADAPFTDKWDTDAALSYVHTYSLGGESPVTAWLNVQFAGVADNRGPWDVFANGTLLGQIPENNSADAFQEVKLYSWAVPVGLLTESDSILLNINVPGVTDGYSINFSELVIKTDAAGVPDGGWTLGLAGVGLLGVLGLRRRLA